MLVDARKVATVHLCFESGGLLFCSSGWCLFAFLFALPLSSTVACCCKNRASYIAWSSVGVWVSWLHALAAVNALDTRYHPRSRVILRFCVQLLLCGLSVLIVVYGFKVSCALRKPVHPMNSHVGAQARSAPTYASAQASHLRERNYAPHGGTRVISQVASRAV